MADEFDRDARPGEQRLDKAVGEFAIIDGEAKFVRPGIAAAIEQAGNIQSHPCSWPFCRLGEGQGKGNIYGLKGARLRCNFCDCCH